MSENGMVRPCSRPSSKPSWQGAPKTKERAMSEKLNSEVAVIGIDIGKNSFHLVGQDQRGSIVLRQKWSRGQVEARLANLRPCLIVDGLRQGCGEVRNGRLACANLISRELALRHR